MKIQLVLLLVVLFVSLPSVVLAQPPLSAVQSGETSQVAPKVEAVKKSWEGPLFGFGLGLGVARATAEYLGESEDTPLVGLLPVQIRLGYGLSDRTVLYGSVFGVRTLVSGGEWTVPGGGIGVMHRGSYDSSYYWFSSLGASFEGDPRPIWARGGYGREVSPGLSVEGACLIEYFNYEGVSFTTVGLDLTFNYHFY